MASTTTLGLHAPIGGDPLEPATEATRLTDPTDVAILAAQLDLLIPQPGFMQSSLSPDVPTGWIPCVGGEVSRASFPDLFAALCPPVGTFTMTIASPSVFTSTAHGLLVGDPVYLTTTGALPTGFLANTVYYATVVTANTFRLASSYVLALAGTGKNGTGTQSGVHTVTRCPHGLGDGSTTFSIPNMSGRVPVGHDPTSLGLRVGLIAGESEVTLTSADLPDHQHAISVSNGSGAGANFNIDAIVVGSSSAATFSTGTLSGGAPVADGGGDGAHNNMQPFLAVNWLVKT